MNNYLSYCGLLDAKIRASNRDLPVNIESELWSPQFSQKTNEIIRLYCYDTLGRIVSVHFLGELKTPKRHFEIN